MGDFDALAIRLACFVHLTLVDEVRGRARPLLKCSLHAVVIVCRFIGERKLCRLIIPASEAFVVEKSILLKLGVNVVE